MKFKILHIVFVVLLLHSYCQIYAQTYSECKKTVKSYYDKGIAGFTVPSGKKVHYYHFIFESEPWEYNPGFKTKVDTRVYLSKNQTQYITEDVLVFKDKVATIMKINNPKIIVVSDPEEENDEEEQLTILKMFTDSVFETSHILDCKKVVNSNNQRLMLVTMLLGEKAMEVTDVEKIVYQINISKNILEKIIMYYVVGAKFKKSMMEYVETDLDYKKNMSVPVLDLFFDNNGKLYNKYAQYRVVDNR